MSSETLDAAAAAGRELTAGAVWHDGRCSWIGATSEAVGTYRALGPTLYKGTAGVGLFLAHLARVTGETEPRATAVGALRHALAVAARRPEPGFQVGAAGVAWAAAGAAAVIDAPELHAGARALVALAPPGSPDVLTGTAGTVLGQLALSAPLQDPSLVERAAAAGETLLAGAVEQRGGWSWATPDRGCRRHLYGLAHGSSGIAWALAELFAATGDERFRAGAERGFAYERSWLDERAGRWARERTHGSLHSATGTWCHGEAGIAFTRARAAALLGSEAHRRAAEIARAATEAWLAEALRDGIRDLSLCHGVTGAAEALAHDHPRRAEVAAAALAQAPRDWPGGVAPGRTPALFRGTSGIAWWLLRHHDPSVPSPLGLTATPDRS